MLEIRTVGGRIAIQVALTLATIPFLVPLAIMSFRSMQGGNALANYLAVLSRPEFLTFLVNSVVIAAGSVAVTFACTMLAAYALAKLPLRGREVAFYLMVAALTLPSAALTIPLFINVRSLGLYNTPLAVILPIAALQTAFGVFLARGFMAGIPDETLDAARIDGASTFGVFWHIVLPLSRPISAVIIVWTFVAAWNEYLLPLLFLQKLEQQTITLLPSFFTGQFHADQPKIFAATVLIALPTVICYAAFSRFFERGLIAGSIK